MLLGCGRRAKLTVFVIVAAIPPISNVHTCVATRPRIVSRTRERAWWTAPSTSLISMELLGRGPLVASPACCGSLKLGPVTSGGRSSFCTPVAPACVAVGVVAPIASSAVPWGAISSGGRLGAGGIGRDLRNEGRRLLLTIIFSRYVPSRLIFGLSPSTWVLLVTRTPSIITSIFRCFSRLVRKFQAEN